MISNVLTLGLFPKSTPGRDLLDFSLEPGSLTSGLLSRMPKMLSQLSDGLPYQFFFGCFQIRLGGFFVYSNTNVWTLTFDSYISLKVQNNHLVVWNIWNEGIRFFCSSIKGFDPISKGRSFFPENGATRKNPLDKLLFFSSLHAFYHLQPTGARDFSRVYWGVLTKS